MTARYLLPRPISAVTIEGGTKKVIRLPSDTVVEVTYPLRASRGLIEATVKGRGLLMFAEDIRERGRLVPPTSGPGTARGRVKKTVAEKRRWCVILAGGDGIRLRSLTRLVSGDDRPKQFCRLLNGRSLLAHTRERAARSIFPDHTLFVLVRSHEAFYVTELAEVPPAGMIVQPMNRGTLPAIFCSLLQIARLDQRAVVAFLPSDHYYSDEGAFTTGIEMAFAAAEADRHSVILIGVRATRPEVDYGWIEVDRAPSPAARYSLMRVKRFWEKPSLPVAKDLLTRDCVWNTFVMVGQAKAFLNLIRSAAPEICRSLEPLYFESGGQMHSLFVEAVYEALPSADLSREVLSAAPERLRVLCLNDVDWSDVGSPERLIEVLSRTGELNDGLASWSPDASRLPASRESGTGDNRARSARAAS